MGNKRTGVSIASESSILLTFTYQEQRCWERVKTRGKPTSADLNAGKETIKDIKTAIRNGSFDYASTFPDSEHRHKFALGGSTKFKPFLNRWHKEHVEESDLQDATKNTNSGIVKRLNENLGKYYLSEITPDLIQKFFKKKTNPITGKKISTKTINNYLSILRPALQNAVNNKLLKESPIENITIKGSKSIAKESIEPFSYAEMNTCLSNCSGQLHNIFKFHFWTGLRPSELIELKYFQKKNS